jgi:cell division protein FtsB
MNTIVKFVKKHNLFVIAVFFGFTSLVSVYSKYQDLAQKNSDLRAKLEQLAVENKALVERQHKLQTDPIFAESVAREKMKVAQEGEVIYKILPED